MRKKNGSKELNDVLMLNQKKICSAYVNQWASGLIRKQGQIHLCLKLPNVIKLIILDIGFKLSLWFLFLWK